MSHKVKHKPSLPHTPYTIIQINILSNHKYILLYIAIVGLIIFISISIVVKQQLAIRIIQPTQMIQHPLNQGEHPPMFTTFNIHNYLFGDMYSSRLYQEISMCNSIHISINQSYVCKNSMQNYHILMVVTKIFVEIINGNICRNYIIHLQNQEVQFTTKSQNLRKLVNQTFKKKLLFYNSKLVQNHENILIIRNGCLQIYKILKYIKQKELQLHQKLSSSFVEWLIKKF
eukprot:TRINITY_DN7249_c0_g1_i11.p1 TRINITY_DN7249_c0_g1~~TRINITY_DN7249_c0_g1_i11.p1  ORF type:complete len:269 (+),score=-14.28 TRINITY_DN7249_c0_g1_i11:123-809(+)